MKFDKLTEGMVLWDVKKATGLSRYHSPTGYQCWSVRIIEIDKEKRKALVSWNTNKPHWVYERQIEKYRAKKPERKTP